MDSWLRNSILPSLPKAKRIQFYRLFLSKIPIHLLKYYIFKFNEHFGSLKSKFSFPIFDLTEKDTLERNGRLLMLPMMAKNVCWY